MGRPWSFLRQANKAHRGPTRPPPGCPRLRRDACALVPVPSGTAPNSGLPSLWPFSEETPSKALLTFHWVGNLSGSKTKQQAGFRRAEGERVALRGGLETLCLAFPSRPHPTLLPRRGLAPAALSYPWGSASSTPLPPFPSPSPLRPLPSPGSSSYAPPNLTHPSSPRNHSLRPLASLLHSALLPPTPGPCRLRRPPQRRPPAQPGYRLPAPSPPPGASPAHLRRPPAL